MGRDTYLDGSNTASHRGSKLAVSQHGFGVNLMMQCCNPSSLNPVIEGIARSLLTSLVQQRCIILASVGPRAGLRRAYHQVHTDTMIGVQPSCAQIYADMYTRCIYTYVHIDIYMYVYIFTYTYMFLHSGYLLKVGTKQREGQLWRLRRIHTGIRTRMLPKP